MLYLETRGVQGVLRWSLLPQEYLLGRAGACDLVIDDPSVSRQHLKLLVDDSRVVLEDLGSRHGVWVDGKRVEHFSLTPGEWFHVGVVPMVLREGISIGGRDSSFAESRAGGGNRARGVEGTTLGGVQTARGDEGLRDGLDSLVRILGADTSDEDLLTRLLALFSQASLSESAALLEDQDGESLLRACWGAPEIVNALPEFLVSGELDGFETIAIEQHGATLGSLVYQPLSVDGRGVLSELIVSLLGRELSRVPRDRIDTQDLGAPVSARALGSAGQRPATPSFIASSGVGRALLAEVDRLAGTDLPVVLMGETGTGKELLARRLHDLSPRGEMPFVALNCAALPTELLEAELFGIKKGVATGVDERQGWFVRASGGTLFLDEIGDLPASLQPKLLRVLETKQVFPLGARDAVDINVRVVSASHRDLKKYVAKSTFRDDLLYRLSGAVIRVPPLRDRLVDILPLAQVFARMAAREHGCRFRGIDVDAGCCLAGYRWPGNVRELKHAIERAVVLADGPILCVEHLPPEISDCRDEAKGALAVGLAKDWRTARESFDRVYFSGLLERCEGNLSEASRIAGLARSNLYRRLKELGLH